MMEGEETGEMIRIGITHVHHFYTKRNLCVLASFARALANLDRKLNLLMPHWMISFLEQASSQDRIVA